mgnify:CR=1 FL=1
MEFLKILLIILLIYFGLRVFLRIFFPMIMAYLARRIQRKFEGQFGGFTPPESHKNRKEGETVMDKMPKPERNSKKVGEYIDFEEID